MLVSSKGSLAKVWLAAHDWEKHVSRKDVTHTDIGRSVQEIVDPAHGLALRVSGQLLLGVVRIYQKKLKYIQEDAADALSRIKLNFRPLLLNEESVAEGKPSIKAHKARERAVTLKDALEEGSGLDLQDLELKSFGDSDLQLRGIEIEASMSEMLDLMQSDNKDLVFRSVQGDGDQRLDDLLYLEPDQDFEAMDIDLERPRREPEGPILEGSDLIEVKSIEPNARDVSAKDILELDNFDLPTISLEGSVLGRKRDSDLGSFHVSLAADSEIPDIRVKKSRKQKVAVFQGSIQLSQSQLFNERNTHDIVFEDGFRPTICADYTITSLDSILEMPLSIRLGPHSALADFFQQKALATDEVKLDGSVSDIALEENTFVPVEEAGDTWNEPGVEDLDMAFSPSDQVEAALHQHETVDDVKLEQQDEGEWNLRTKKAYQLFRHHSKSGPIILQNFVKGKPRRAAAILFHETLVLKTKDLIDIEQSQPFGPISVSIRRDLPNLSSCEYSSSVL